MADDYIISNVGADDYDISNVGHRGGSHPRARGRNDYGGYGYMPDPLFYQIVLDDDGHYKKVADDDTDDNKGSTVAGLGPNGAWPAWLQTHINNANTPDRQRWVSFAMAIEELDSGYGRLARQNPKDANLQAKAKRYSSYTKPNGPNTKPDDPFWLTNPVRTADRDEIINRVKTHGHKFTTHTAFTPGAFVVHVAGDIIHTANNAAKLAGKAVNAVEKTIEKIPVVGQLAHAVVGLDPAKMLGGMAASVLHGERIDHVFLDAGKKQLAGIKEIAPYAAQIVSFVPGVGTGVAAAIAAGTALAEGKTVTDALIAAAKGAVPGGQLGASALDAAVAIAGGANVASATANAALQQLPPAAQQAAKVAIAAAKGQNVKGAVLQAIRSQLPADAQKALDVGAALGTARNVQSALVGALAKGVGMPALAKQGATVLASNPKFVQAATGLAPAARQGYTAAMGLLSSKGVNPHAIVAMRQAATPPVQAGIDHALKTYVNHFTPDWPTFVSNGSALRGNWKADKKGTKGRLVQNGRVILGTFSRMS